MHRTFLVTTLLAFSITLSIPLFISPNSLTVAQGPTSDPKDQQIADLKKQLSELKELLGQSKVQKTHLDLDIQIVPPTPDIGDGLNFKDGQVIRYLIQNEKGAIRVITVPERLYPEGMKLTRVEWEPIGGDPACLERLRNIVTNVAGVREFKLSMGATQNSDSALKVRIHLHWAKATSAETKSITETLRAEREARERAIRTSFALKVLALPLLENKVAELDRSTPTEIHYGLQGKSVGRNGLREEVPKKDIIQGGKKVNETSFNFFGKFAWAEKGGTWGPPGFQYYIFRHPLTLKFSPDDLEFTLSTRVDFKAAVAINYDTGVLGFKPWVFAETGFRDEWPRTVEVSIKSRVTVDKTGKLSTTSTSQVKPTTPIVFHTFHGAVKRDCSNELVAILKEEMDKIATRFDAEVAKIQIPAEK